MNIRCLWLCAASAFVAVVVAACGSESDGSRDNNLNLGDGGGDSAGEPDRDGGASNDDGGPGGPGNRCATRTAESTVIPTNLVVLFDRSGSLGDSSTGNNRATRWEPITRGMKTFFSDGRGLNASLLYFPVLGPEGRSSCNVGDYAKPVVQRLPLPSPAFATSIDRQEPVGGSPIRPALEGAVEVAKQTISRYPNEKTAIVLVTDGAPSECDSTYPTVRGVVEKTFRGSPPIPTFVVAVGPEGADLNQLAQVGGTTKAIQVEVGDPNKAAQALLAEVNKIRKFNVPCSVALPEPPAGKKFDMESVAVTVTPPSGQPRTLPFNDLCANGSQGWRYDNPSMPKTVTVCAAACQDLQKDAPAKLSVGFACLAN